MNPKKDNHRWSLLITLLTLLTGTSFAQSPTGEMTLQQCIQYGLAHNANVVKAGIQTERSVEKQNETRAGYLPQVNGSVSLTDNLQLQTSILPGEIIGQPGTQVAVQFGTQYNVLAALDATQVLYDQSLITTMKITKQNATISELNTKKSQEQVSYDIASAYYAAQVTFTQKAIIASNLAQVDTLLKITQVQVDNGFAKQLDIDRLIVNQTNLQTDLATSELNYQQQLLLLKYYMGMPQETAITLPVITGKEQSQALADTESINRTDLDLLDAQYAMYELNLKQIKAGYLPTLSMAFRTGLQIQQNDLRIFGKDADWYPNTYVSLSLNVPIFDGLAKHSRVKQMQMQLRETEIDKEYATEGLKMKRTNAANKVLINKASLTMQERNVALAQQVYETTKTQYTGGIASMSDLINAETSLKTAQTNYLSTLVQVKLAELELLQTTGNISSLN